MSFAARFAAQFAISLATLISGLTLFAGGGIGGRRART
jgi:hypothetical protein